MRDDRGPGRPAYDLAVLGDVGVDVVVVDPAGPGDAPEAVVDRIGLAVGGSAALTASAAARLGVRTCLYAAVGSDHAGAAVRAELAGAGVGVRGLVCRRGARTGVSVVLNDRSGRRILTDHGATRHYAPDARAVRDVLGARHVHVAGYFLAEALREHVPGLLRRARRRGLTTSIDTNWAPGGDWQAVAPVLPHVDYLMPNLAELAHLGAAPAPTNGATCAATVRAATVRAAVPLLRPGLTVVVTAGPAGAFAVRHGDDAVLHAAPGHVAEGDPTGAGDVFTAAFLAAVLRGDADLQEALEQGTRAATAAVGAPAPRRAVAR